MNRFRPVHGVVLVLLFLGGMVTLELARDASGKDRFELVRPGPDGLVRISVDQLGRRQLRFFRYLSLNRQEVRFFVGRDDAGGIQVAFDASEVCSKTKRGFRGQAEWVVCNKCDKSFHLADVNRGGGGCMPIPLEHRLTGSELIIAESDIIKGWQLFT